MQFEGQKVFTQLPPVVFAKLADARFLVDCIPGRESLLQADEKSATCTQRPGFAFVRGTLELTITILDTNPESEIKYSLASKGIGSTSTVETVMNLLPKEGGTTVNWKANVTNLGGLLKAVPSGLIRGAAQKVIADVWQEIEKRLSA